MAPRPLILLSNDDGVHAPGLRALNDAVRAFADTVVVAPETEQSAGSHALTLYRPLRHRELEPNIHAIDGTPADCIYVALFLGRLLPRTPDLVLSGINHGLNLGTDTYYSGTVAAAREGALRGIPSMALSLDRGGDVAATAALAAKFARAMVESKKPIGATVLLNVNFPKTPPKGVRATRLGKRLYEDLVDTRQDPRGREYFWIGGPAAHHEQVDGSDTEAIDHSLVSITPLSLDGTAPEHFGVASFVAAQLPEADHG